MYERWVREKAGLGQARTQQHEHCDVKGGWECESYMWGIYLKGFSSK